MTLTVACLAGLALALAACKQKDGFDLADTTPDGVVDQAEFERYMLEVIYSEGDRDADSRITFAEWKIANPDADKARFAEADADGDGAITPDEARLHFKNQKSLDDLFSKVDADSSGGISREEAKAFLSRMESEAGTKMQQIKKAADQS